MRPVKRDLCYALVAAVLLVARISADSSFCNIEEWESAIAASCLSGDLQNAHDLIVRASNCSSSPEFHQELRIFTPYASLNEKLQPRAQSSGAGYNASVIEVIIGISDDTPNATEELHRDVLSYYDGFVVGAEFLPEFAQVGVVAPLDQAIITEPELSWYRVNRYYRAFSASHQARVYGIPLSGAGAFTFYRLDLFNQFNITVPTTWDGLLATARDWSEKQHASGIAPFCMSSRPQCTRTLLLSIAAPYLQTGGTREGFLIDPANGTLLFNTSGFTRALRTWQQLSSLAAVDADAACYGGPDAFSEGRCLMTVQRFLKFKVYASNTSAVAGVLGVALTPGSAVVMNRTTGVMEDCTGESCPHAKRVGQAGGLVNVAPFMWGGLVGMVSARNPWGMRLEIIHYFADLTSNRSLENVLRKDSRLSPFRADHWSAAAKRNWTDAGYSEPAVAQMLAVLEQLHASPNQALQLRLPGQADVTNALNAGIRDLGAGHAAEDVASALQASVAAILAARYGADANGTVGYLAMYRQQLGYVQRSAGAEAPPSRRSAAGVSRQTVVVIAVVIGLVVLLASVVVLEVRNKRRHKDLLGRVKPPLGDPDTTIVVASIQDFDELWEALLSDASERALQQFSDLVDCLLRRHSGYRAPSEEDEEVVAAFHNPRDACEFARELQRGLLELRWPKHVLEMEQFRPQYLARTKRATSFSQGCNGARTAAVSPLTSPMPAAEDDDKLFTLDTATENVRSFGEQCVSSWTPAEPSSTPDAELVFCGIRARVGVCAVGFSQLGLELEPGRRRFTFVGEAVEVAAAAAAAAQGGMVLIPQSTFRQLHLELLAEQCLFCHLGEYQLTSELPPMDLYLALDRHLLGRLALFGPLACHMQWSQGAFAAPVHSASMVFTHVVGVQTLLAWDYDLMQDVIETFTKLAQVELQQAGGYLVEHVEGFMLTAFHSPADAILWGLRMQELMLKEDWPEELLAHELCEEVTVTVPVRGGEVTSATVFRGPRLKTGIDIGQVLARLHTMTGRMTYRGKVMNRAARISAAASSGQVLCSAEAWESCTASASALRLVTATSLGLFQLKGIQERIEVFHCTYQRHVPSSTRRSSTVSVGVVSSSDNRRKSAVVLSSMSHASHHTTSYRTSLHNSVALEHVSASDATGGRRGSHASSSALAWRGSVGGGGQLSDMLHMVGADAIPSGSGGAGAGPSALVAAASTSLARCRAAAVPVVAGGDGAGGAGCVSQTGSCHRSQGSGASGAASVLASRAALGAVLQSRTRSASAIQAGSSVSPFRSASARSRRPVGLSGGAVASEPQVCLAAGAQQSAKWNAATATSPSATPSLAMATAVAAAAAHERTNGAVANHHQHHHHHAASINSPKSTAALELPRGVSANGNATDSAASTHSMTFVGLSGVNGGANADPAATMAAAVYAVLPSVVLSGGLPAAAATTVQGAASATAHEVQETRGGVNTGGLVGGRSHAAASPDGFISCAASCMMDSSPNDLQMATIATCVEDVMALDARGDGDGGGDGGGDGTAEAYGATADGLRAESPPPSSHVYYVQRLRQYQHQQLPAPPFHFERVLPLGTLQEDSPPAEMGMLCGGDMGMLDDGSRVETLEVTVSATGIVRGALSGAASSNGLATAVSSSHGVSISRCGSVGVSYLPLGLSGGLGSSTGGPAGGGAAAVGVSYLPLGLSGGLGSSTGGPAGGGAAAVGSHASSCESSHTHGAAAAAAAPRPLSTAAWRTSMSFSASPHLHGLASPPSAMVHRSGSASSADLFLPFPLGAGVGGGGGGGTANSTSSGMATAAAGASLQPIDGELSDGDAALGANSRGQTQSSGGEAAAEAEAAAAAVGPVASGPMAVRQRNLAAVHNGRLAATVAAGTLSAAPIGRAAAQNASAGASISQQAAGMAPPTGSPVDAAPAARASPTGHSAAPTSAADGGGAAVAAVAPPRVVRLSTVTCDASGPDSLVPESRSNSGHASAAAVAAAAGRDGGDAGGRRLGFAGGSGSGSRSGLLRASNRTGSGVSNDLPSHAVSPSSTWVSGGSAGSSSTATIPATVSISPATASCAGLEQHHHRRQQQQQQQHSSLQALLGGMGVSVGLGAGGDAGAPADAAAAAPEAALQRGGEGGAGGGGAGDHGATAAMAAAFGMPPPPPVGNGDDGGAVAAVAAAFGVGPSPLGEYSRGDDGIRGTGGPTREQLALALELLGESRHAPGSGWR